MKPPTTATVPPPLWQILIAFGAVYIIWGSTYLAIHYAVETLPPLAMAGSRFTVAGAALMAVTFLRGIQGPTARQWRSAAVTGGLLLAGGNGMVVLAERQVSSSITALIIATTPVWFALGEWLLPGGRRPSFRTWAGIGLGIGGVAFLSFTRDTSSTAQSIPITGLIFLVIATISWASGSLLVKRLDKPASPWMMSGAQMVSGGGILLVMASLRGEWSTVGQAPISERSWLAWTYLIVFGSWIGFSAYVWLLKVSSPARVSTYAYVNPVVALLLGGVVAGEPISFHTLVAAATLLAGVALVVWPNRPNPVPSLSKPS